MVFVIQITIMLPVWDMIWDSIVTQQLGNAEMLCKCFMGRVATRTELGLGLRLLLKTFIY